MIIYTNRRFDYRESANNRYAFIEFATADEAKIGLELSGTDILEDGKPLKVSLSRNPISTPSNNNSIKTAPVPPPNTLSNESAAALMMSYQTGALQPTSQMDDQYNNYYSETDVKKKAEEEEKIKKTIYVTSIDTQITESQICEFFSYCGKILNYRVCGDTQHPTRFAFFEFEAKESAVAAISLSGQFLGRYALRILGSRTVIQPTPGAVGNGATYSFTPAHHDQINRTVYVGNVDVGLTEDDLKDFFDANCGPVTKVVLAGDVVHSARFAFVEFLHFESRNKALDCSGTLLGNRNIRINPSRTPILGGGKAYASTAPSINPATGTGQYAVNHLTQSRIFPPIAPITDPYYNQTPHHYPTKKMSMLPTQKKKTATETTPLGAHKPYTDADDADQKKRRKNDWSSSDDDSDNEGHEERRQKKQKAFAGQPSTDATAHIIESHPQQEFTTVSYEEDESENHTNGDSEQH